MVSRIFVGIAVLLVFAGGVFLGASSGRWVPPDLMARLQGLPPRAEVVQPQVARPTAVSALGRIEPRDGLLSLTVSFPDHVKELTKEVVEGGTVKKDALLVVLESYDAKKVEYEVARRQYENAVEQRQLAEKNFQQQQQMLQLKLEKIESVDTVNIEMQKAKAKLLKDQLDLLSRQVEVMTQLSSYSRQEVDQQRLSQQEAQGKLDAAKLELKQLQASLEMSRKSIQEEKDVNQILHEKTMNEIQVGLLELQQELAQLQLRATELRAPYDAHVLKITAHPGELIGPQRPILYLAGMDMVVVAEVYQTERNQIRPGQTATIKLRDGSGRVLTGTVEHVSQMVGKNRIFPTNPLEEVDRRVVEVQIDVAEDAAAADSVDGEVDVTIETGDATAAQGPGPDAGTKGGPKGGPKGAPKGR